MINIGLASMLMGRGRSLHKLTPPNKTEQIVLLHGDVFEDSGTYYLRDSSGNGKHFIITGYDWYDDSVIKNTVIPFRTAARISAPAGDAELIAADVNNFLYDSGGTPRQIPPQLFFQNIDFAGKIFCKHVDFNVINDVAPFDDREIVLEPAGIKSITIYSAAQTSTDLDACNTFFEVLEIPESNFCFVSATGNNTTGDGSYENPYLTLTKANAILTTGGSCFIFGGLYEHSSTQSTLTKLLHVVGIGFSHYRTSLYNVYNRSNSSFSGIYFETTSQFNYNILYDTVACNAIWDKCLFIGGVRNFYQNSNLTETFTSTNSYFKILGATGRNIELTCSDYSVSWNYIDGSANAFLHVRNTTPNTINLNYNKFDNLGIVSYLPTYNFTTFNFKNNIGQIGSFFASDGNPITGDVYYQGNNLTQTGGNLFTYYGNGVRNFSYNRLTQINSVVNLIDIRGENLDIKIKGNTLIKGSAATGSLVQLLPKASGASSTFIIENNYFYVDDNGVDGTIIIGNSSVATVKNKLSGEYRYNTFIYSPYASVGGSHRLQVYGQSDIKIHHNYHNGRGLNFVFKGDSDDFTNASIYANISVNGTIVLKGVNNSKVYNNTIYSGRITILLNPGYPTTQNNIIKNNIVIGTALESPFSIENVYIQTIDNNRIYAPNGIVNAYGSISDDFTEWQARGFDINGEYGDVSFVDEDSVNGCYPVSTIPGGADLGVDFDDALDYTNNFLLTLRNDLKVVKQAISERSTWNLGAYK